MMQNKLHLIIQIPCYNEADTLAQVISSLPTQLPGIDRIETLVIDDGSQDETSLVAKQSGVNYIVRHPRNRGLAAAFQSGLDACLQAGADIIINMDGDGQHPGSHIELLLSPLLQHRADMVIGYRPNESFQHFTFSKKFLEQFGSWVVRRASGTDVPDAVSGFRAFSRDCALRLTVLSNYTYTVETIIQAKHKGLRIAHVPVNMGQAPRKSRLIQNNWRYVWRQGSTILRLYALYEPLRTFMLISSPFVFVGLALIVRFIYFYITGQTGFGRHVQSLIVSGTFIIVGLLIFLIGIMADISSLNRRLIEDILYRTKKRDLLYQDTILPTNVAEKIDQQSIYEQNN